MNLQKIDKILGVLGSGFLTLNEKGFFYGSQGKLLRRNLESLWYESCVTAASFNIFLSDGDKISETLENLRKTSSDERPFGIAIVEDSKIPWSTNTYPNNSKNILHKLAKVIVVSDDENSKDIYHKKQRERKVWWRKYSREPSRFSLTESKKNSKNEDFVEIVAKFPFGDVILETIIHRRDPKKICSQIGSKEILSDVQTVEHAASLDWGSLVMLCDGFSSASLDSLSTESKDKGILKIHPRISPYKVGFYLENAEGNETANHNERKRLILYLNNLLRKKGVETVLTRNKKGIETFHVPLTIDVDETSLKNGIVHVTSQLTTIAEAVHVTDLTKYVTARCN